MARAMPSRYSVNSLADLRNRQIAQVRQLDPRQAALVHGIADGCFKGWWVGFLGHETFGAR